MYKPASIDFMPLRTKAFFLHRCNPQSVRFDQISIFSFFNGSFPIPNPHSPLKISIQPHLSAEHSPPSPTFLSKSHLKSKLFITPSLNQTFRLGAPNPSLRRSIHGSSVDAKIPNEAEEEEKPPPLTDQTTEIARQVCKLLSANPRSSDIESALGSNGAKLEVSDALVLDVLSLLNNAGNLALGFFRWAEKQRGFTYTTQSYNALIDTLGKTRQFDLIWKLVESMREKRLLAKDTFMIIIKSYAKAKMISEAVMTFEEMEMFGFKPDLSDFNRFLNTLCFCDQIKIAHQLFDEMKKRKFYADRITYGILLQGWGQEQDLAMLEAVYGEMRNEGFEPDAVTYGIIINAYCKARQMDKAIEVFRGIRNPTPRIYCTLISALGSQGRTIEALKFFKMYRANFAAPEAHIYNAVVRSYCSALRFDDAYWVLDEMRKLGVGPNSRTYDIILHHLVKAQRTKEAYVFFRSVINNERDSGLSASTYEIVVRMFCNLGKLEKAVEVWDQMKANGILPNTQMFAMIICSLCRERKLTEACEYFKDMLDMGIDPPRQLFKTLKDYLLCYGKKDAAFGFSQRLEQIRKARLLT